MLVMKKCTLINAKQNFRNIIKEVVEYNTFVEILNTDNPKENVVVVSKEYFDVIQETMYLMDNRIDEVVKKRNDGDTLNIDAID